MSQLSDWLADVAGEASLLHGRVYQGTLTPAEQVAQVDAFETFVRESASKLRFSILAELTSPRHP